MSPHEQRSIEEHMRSLDDHQLQRLVAVESSTYRPEALAIARAELERRRVEIPGHEEYLSHFPSERIAADGFCAECRSQTTDESPGNTTTVNLVFGTRLSGHDDICGVCGSVLQTMWFWFVIPIFPMGKYRVRWVENGYIGRRILTPEDFEVSELAQELCTELANKVPSLATFLSAASPILYAPWPGTEGKCTLTLNFVGDRFEILLFDSQKAVHAKREIPTRGGMRLAISEVTKLLETDRSGASCRRLPKEPSYFTSAQGHCHFP
jgi:hypothetical protein